MGLEGGDVYLLRLAAENHVFKGFVGVKPVVRFGACCSSQNTVPIENALQDFDGISG